MSGYLKTIVSVFLLWIFPALHAGAQTRFEEKVEEEFWLQSRNINGVRGIPVYSEPRGFSFAEFHTGFESGRFHDISDADRASRAGVRAGTLTHLHKSSFLGTISFDQRNGTGTRTQGSILTAPGRYPFDFLVTTPGDKTLRTLYVTGGYTLTLSPSWAVGGKMGFTYENAARRTETRLTSRRFDLSLEPSVLFRHDDFRAGLSLLFRKQNEAFTNGKNGPSVFLNEGLFYGLRSDLGGIGNSFTPISSLSCGAAVQGSLMEKVCLEVAYIRSMGETGDKTISGYTFPENKVSMLAEFRWGGSITQWVRLRYEGRALSNEKTLPDWNGLIFKDREDRLTLTTQGMTHRGSGFLVRLSADRRARRAFRIPPEATATSREILANGGLSIWHNFGPWRLTFGADFRRTLFDKDSLELPEADLYGIQFVPYRQTFLYDRDHEYRLAPRNDVRLAVRYNLPFGLYAEVEGVLTRGYRLEFLNGKTRFLGGFRLGMEF